jgi:hypothetical protein
MKRDAQIVLVILLALGLVACSPAKPTTQPASQTLEPSPTAEALPTQERSPTREPTPDSQPERTAPYHPLTTRTGIEDVDKIVDVVARDDAQMLRSLIQFTDTKCTTADGLGGPPKCRAGEVEGTPVEVLPILGPEGHFFHKEDIEDWAGVKAAGLYAVYEVSSEGVPDPDYPAGQYAAMFFDKENQWVISLRVANGKIVRVDYLFDTSPKMLNEWLQREAANVILAPAQQ